MCMPDSGWQHLLPKTIFVRMRAVSVRARGSLVGSIAIVSASGAFGIAGPFIRSGSHARFAFKPPVAGTVLGLSFPGWLCRGWSCEGVLVKSGVGL